jgi:hypothetical protein
MKRRLQPSPLQALIRFRLLIKRRQNGSQIILDIQAVLDGNCRNVHPEGTAQFTQGTVEDPTGGTTVTVGGKNDVITASLLFLLLQLC